MLGKALLGALNRANDERMEAIAIPALCTGQIGLNASEVARVMLNTAIEFSRTSGPGSSLQEMRFVLFDDSVFQAFSNQLKDQVQPSAPRSHQRSPRPHPARPPMGRGQPTLNPSPHTKGTLKAGGVLRGTVPRSEMVVQVVNVNLLEELTDAIVVSIPPETSIRDYRGVAGMVFEAGGPQMIAQRNSLLQASGRPSLPLFSALSLDAGHKLKCRHVICGVLAHRVSANDAIFRTTTNCLQKAKELRLQSVSFPILGAKGYNFPIDTCGAAIMKAIRDFGQGSGRYPSCVRVVVFDPDHFDAVELEFWRHITSAVPSSDQDYAQHGHHHGRQGAHEYSTAHRLADDDYCGSYSSAAPEVRGGRRQTFPSRGAAAEVRMTLYGPNQPALLSTKQDIDALIDKKHCKITIEDHDSANVEQLYGCPEWPRIEQKIRHYGLSMRMVGNPREPSGIELQGPPARVMDVKSMIEGALNASTLFDHMSRFATYVQWYRVVSGQDEEYDPMINDKLEQAFSAKPRKREVAFKRGRQTFVVNMEDEERMMEYLHNEGSSRRLHSRGVEVKRLQLTEGKKTIENYSFKPSQKEKI